MLWIKIVKLLMKHVKIMVVEMKKERSSSDPDSPNVLTKEEISMVVINQLLEAVPEVTELLSKKRR